MSNICPPIKKRKRPKRGFFSTGSPPPFLEGEKGFFCKMLNLYHSFYGVCVYINIYVCMFPSRNLFLHDL